ncbi:MAG TPA: class I SAM-dependent methyltransferase [Planctomycetota bacterium]|nr:class I SAM-dependent methyltransferase [Planctomycetota bacterium]
MQLTHVSGKHTPQMTNVYPPTARILPARGHIEFLEHTGGVGGSFFLVGWMMMPGVRFDRFEVELEGYGRMAATRRERPDIVAVVRNFPEVLHSGFFLELPWSEDRLSSAIGVKIYGIPSRESERPNLPDEYCLHAVYFPNFKNLPFPPENLRTRVSNLITVQLYRASAQQHFGAFQNVAQRHLSAGIPARFLDWGCGCGRLMSLATAMTHIDEVYGCDIDPEGVAWRQESLPRAKSVVIDPVPPLPYEDDFFDMIIGYSVMTHLDSELQIQWLKELKRVLAPGGLCLLTTHGDLAAEMVADAPVTLAMQRSGISDGTHDPNLDGIAPEGYYRATFQTQAYTERVWSRVMPIKEYIPLGLNLQDIVVITK